MGVQDFDTPFDGVVETQPSNVTLGDIHDLVKASSSRLEAQFYPVNNASMHLDVRYYLGDYACRMDIKTLIYGAQS